MTRMENNPSNQPGPALWEYIAVIAIIAVAVVVAVKLFGVSLIK
jgi:hypothetical protein